MESGSCEAFLHFLMGKKEPDLVGFWILTHRRFFPMQRIRMVSMVTVLVCQGWGDVAKVTLPEKAMPGDG